MSALRILQLYPQELGINGDRGNVLALTRRLEWRGLAVEVVEAGPGDRLPAQPHLVHIGHGPRSALRAVLERGAAHHALLRDWAAAGVPVVAIGSGFHLLAAHLVDAGGDTVDGAGVLPVTVREVGARVVGEVLGTATEAGRIAGFVNHGVAVDRGGLTPFVTLERGPGDGDPQAEGDAVLDGVRHGSVMATHVGGPLLPMNPSVADELLAAALGRIGRTLPEPDDRVLQADERARRARAAIAARLGRAGVEV